MTVSQLEEEIGMAFEQERTGLELLPNGKRAAFLAVDFGNGQDLVDLGAAFENSFAATADDDPNLGFGIHLLCGGDCRGQNERIANVLWFHKENTHGHIWFAKLYRPWD